MSLRTNIPTFNLASCLIVTVTFTVNKGNNKITEQSYKRKGKTHKYINRQNQSTTGKLIYTGTKDVK